MSKNLANFCVNLCPLIDKKLICSKADHFGYKTETSDKTSTNGAYVFLHLLLGYCSWTVDYQKEENSNFERNLSLNVASIGFIHKWRYGTYINEGPGW